MKLHDPALMAALLDGELKGWRRRFVQRHVATCPACAVEYRQQVQARRLLKENPPQYSMGVSQDFFWSKVRGEIQRRGEEEVEIGEPRLSLADWLWLRPTAVVAVAATLVGLLLALGLLQIGGSLRSRMASAPPPTVAGRAIPTLPGAATAAILPEGMVEEATAPVPNTAVTTFHSEDAGATVIWVSGLPWTADMNEMQAMYASLGT